MIPRLTAPASSRFSSSLTLTRRSTFSAMSQRRFLQLDFVDCDHGKGAPDAVGLVLTVDDKRIYFAGDTCFRRDIAQSIASKYKIDVLIAPINGAFGNLNEEECAELANIIKPSITIPCHYGLFASHGGNVGLFYKIMTEKYPQIGFKLMAFEEKLVLE